MKTYFVAAAALLAGTPALAQTAPVATAPVAPVAPARPMADQIMTRAEVVAMVRDHFGRLDTNKDGSISTAEIGDLKSKRGGGAWREHSRRICRPRDRAGRFAPRGVWTRVLVGGDN